jgi:hypothetical protein
MYEKFSERICKGNRPYYAISKLLRSKLKSTKMEITEPL